jgi:hypothetical protein
MKKLLLLICFCVANCHLLFSQENLVVFLTDAITDSVPVYRNDTDTICFTKIKEDFQKENWHDVEIMCMSNNRYKVRVIPLNETNAAIFEGWLNKEQCGVWLRGKNQGKGLFTVELYAEPGQSNPITKLYGKEFDDFGKYTNGKAVPVLDFKKYQGHYWIKTIVVKNDNRTVGWTTDYCPNIYGSCN